MAELRRLIREFVQKLPDDSREVTIRNDDGETITFQAQGMRQVLEKWLEKPHAPAPDSDLYKIVLALFGAWRSVLWNSSVHSSQVPSDVLRWHVVLERSASAIPMFSAGDVDRDTLIASMTQFASILSLQGTDVSQLDQLASNLRTLDEVSSVRPVLPISPVRKPLRKARRNAAESLVYLDTPQTLRDMLPEIRRMVDMTKGRIALVHIDTEPDQPIAVNVKDIPEDPDRVDSVLFLAEILVHGRDPAPVPIMVVLRPREQLVALYLPVPARRPFTVKTFHEIQTSILSEKSSDVLARPKQYTQRNLENFIVMDRTWNFTGNTKHVNVMKVVYEIWRTKHPEGENEKKTFDVKHDIRRIMGDEKRRYGFVKMVTAAIVHELLKRNANEPGFPVRIDPVNETRILGYNFFRVITVETQLLIEYRWIGKSAPGAAAASDEGALLRPRPRGGDESDDMVESEQPIRRADNDDDDAALLRTPPRGGAESDDESDDLVESEQPIRPAADDDSDYGGFASPPRNEDNSPDASDEDELFYRVIDHSGPQADRVYVADDGMFAREDIGAGEIAMDAATPALIMSKDPGTGAIGFSLAQLLGFSGDDDNAPPAGARAPVSMRIPSGLNQWVTPQDFVWLRRAKFGAQANVRLVLRRLDSATASVAMRTIRAVRADQELLLDPTQELLDGVRAPAGHARYMPPVLAYVPRRDGIDTAQYYPREPSEIVEGADTSWLQRVRSNVSVCNEGLRTATEVAEGEVVAYYGGPLVSRAHADAAVRYLPETQPQYADADEQVVCSVEETLALGHFARGEQANTRIAVDRPIHVFASPEITISLDESEEPARVRTMPSRPTHVYWPMLATRDIAAGEVVGWGTVAPAARDPVDITRMRIAQLYRQGQADQQWTRNELIQSVLVHYGLLDWRGRCRVLVLGNAAVAEHLEQLVHVDTRHDRSKSYTHVVLLGEDYEAVWRALNATPLVRVRAALVYGAVDTYGTRWHVTHRFAESAHVLLHTEVYAGWDRRFEPALWARRAYGAGALLEAASERNLDALELARMHSGDARGHVEGRLLRVARSLPRPYVEGGELLLRCRELTALLGGTGPLEEREREMLEAVARQDAAAAFVIDAACDVCLSLLEQETRWTEPAVSPPLLTFLEETQQSAAEEAGLVDATARLPVRLPRQLAPMVMALSVATRLQMATESFTAHDLLGQCYDMLALAASSYFDSTVRGLPDKAPMSEDAKRFYRERVDAAASSPLPPPPDAVTPGHPFRDMVAGALVAEIAVAELPEAPTDATPQSVPSDGDAPASQDLLDSQSSRSLHSMAQEWRARRMRTGKRAICASKAAAAVHTPLMRAAGNGHTSPTLKIRSSGDALLNVKVPDEQKPEQAPDLWAAVWAHGSTETVWYKIECETITGYVQKLDIEPPDNDGYVCLAVYTRYEVSPFGYKRLELLGAIALSREHAKQPVLHPGFVKTGERLTDANLCAVQATVRLPRGGRVTEREAQWWRQHWSVWSDDYFRQLFDEPDALCPVKKGVRGMHIPYYPSVWRQWTIPGVAYTLVEPARAGADALLRALARDVLFAQRTSGRHLEKVVDDIFNADAPNNAQVMAYQHAMAVVAHLLCQLSWLMSYTGDAVDGAGAEVFKCNTCTGADDCEGLAHTAACVCYKWLMGARFGDRTDDDDDIACFLRAAQKALRPFVPVLVTMSAGSAQHGGAADAAAADDDDTDEYKRTPLQCHIAAMLLPRYTLFERWREAGAERRSEWHAGLPAWAVRESDWLSRMVLMLEGTDMVFGWIGPLRSWVPRQVGSELRTLVAHSMLSEFEQRLCMLRTRDGLKRAAPVMMCYPTGYPDADEPDAVPPFCGDQFYDAVTHVWPVYLEHERCWRPFDDAVLCYRSVPAELRRTAGAAAGSCYGVDIVRHMLVSDANLYARPLFRMKDDELANALYTLGFEQPWEAPVPDTRFAVPPALDALAAAHPPTDEQRRAAQIDQHERAASIPDYTTSFVSPVTCLVFSRREKVTDEMVQALRAELKSGQRYVAVEVQASSYALTGGTDCALDCITVVLFRKE